jgi:hypothetical protein
MWSEPTRRTTLDNVFKSALGIATVVPFGDERYKGFHDGAQGVQWHVAYEAETGATYLAVNLEGLKYGKARPIQKIVRREAKEPRMVSVLRGLPRAEDVVVHVVREGWPSQRNRIYVEERFILRTVGARVTEEIWLQAMKDAAACLTDDGGRGRQLARRAGTGVPRMMDVLPHITVGTIGWTGPIPADAVQRLVECRRLLEPVYVAMNARVQDWQR